MSATDFAEVIGSPYNAWVAPVGTAFPKSDALDSAVSAPWALLGANGLNNMGSEGLTLNLGETIQEFTPQGGTLPVKAIRTDEKITVASGFVDTTVETIAQILDDAVITTVTPATGHDGEKSISLVRGLQVHTYALLARGISPYDDGTGLKAQYEFARVYQSGSQAPKYVKGSWTEVTCEFTVLGTIVGTDEAIYRAETAAHS